MPSKHPLTWFHYLLMFLFPGSRMKSVKINQYGDYGNAFISHSLFVLNLDYHVCYR